MSFWDTVVCWLQRWALVWYLHHPCNRELEGVRRDLFATYRGNIVRLGLGVHAAFRVLYGAARLDLLQFRRGSVNAFTFMV